MVVQRRRESVEQLDRDVRRPTGGAHDGEATAVPQSEGLQHGRVLHHQHRTGHPRVLASQVPRRDVDGIAAVRRSDQRAARERPETQGQDRGRHRVGVHADRRPQPAAISGGRRQRPVGQPPQDDGRERPPVVERVRVTGDGGGQLRPQPCGPGQQRSYGHRRPRDRPGIGHPGQEPAAAHRRRPGLVHRGKHLERRLPRRPFRGSVPQRSGQRLDDLGGRAAQPVVQLRQDEPHVPGDRSAEHRPQRVPRLAGQAGQPGRPRAALEGRPQRSPHRQQRRLGQPGRDRHPCPTRACPSQV